MPDDKKTAHGIAMDGFNKVRPLNEGYLAKGGINSTSQIKVRPPAPTVLAPKATHAATPAPTAASNKPKA
jgi:hypothetical protein